MEKETDRKLNKKMLERIIIIHNLIKSGVYPNKKAIQRYYCERTGYSKVGEATISRDLECLRTRFNAPLEYDFFKKGFFYTDEKFDFKLNKISANEVFYLSTVKTLLSNFEGGPIYEEINDVISFITETQTHIQSDLLKRISVPPMPKVVFDENIWKIVMKAMQTNTVLEFEYTGRWNTNKKLRRVHPYQVLLEDGMYFLFGFDELAVNEEKELGAERIFCLPRIVNPILTEKTFELPQNFDFASRCSGGKFGTFMESFSENYKIKFYGSARQYIKDYIWADDQQIVDDETEKCSTITFSSAQSVKVLEWVLSQGGKAKPLEPDWFVEKWEKEIRAMNKRMG